MSENPSKQAKPEEKSSKINKKKLTALIAVLVIFLIGAGFLTYSANYARVYPNTYINGVSVSGFSADELSAFCREISENSSLPEALDFTLKGDSISVSASEIDLSFDWEKTAALAMGTQYKNNFWGSIAGYIKSFFNETAITPAVKYDTEKLGNIISEFAAPYETEPVDASYTAENGKLIIKQGHSGIKINQGALPAAIEKYIYSSENPIALTFSDVKGKTFDADSLYKELSSPAEDARYAKNDDGEVIIIPDKPKVTVDKAALEDAIKSNKDTVSLPVKITPAKTTKSALQKALFSGTMGSWTSYFSTSNAPRTSNVVLSAERVNNTVLLPGESFSYDKAVGPRTTQNGFKIAGVYINNKVEDGIGGGVCQTSSTLYSAVLYANLEIVSRTSHSLPVSYMPPGQDATIAEGAIDFVFKNNTEHPVKITATISGGSVTCSIIGTPVKGQKVVISNTTTAVYTPGTEIETDAAIPKGFKKTVKGANGSAVSSTRTVYQDGKIVKTEPLTRSVYHATPHIITVNPEDESTPPENLTEQGTETEVTPPEEIELEGNDPSAEPESGPESEEIIEI